MRNHFLRRLALTLCLFLVPGLGPGSLFAQDGPPPEVRRTVGAIVAVLSASDEVSLERFAQEHLTPTYRESFAPGELVRHFTALRHAARGTGSNRMLRREDDGALYLTLEGERTVTFRLGLTPTGAITGLDLATNPPPEPADSAPPLGWETLGETLSAAEREGFSGTVIAVRGGQTVLREAYGLADRDSGRRSTLDTAYCIGSTPIDFTVTAIRLLGQRGKLKLEDAVGHFFPQAPSDKQSITVAQLLSGGSGLPDFHHREGVDWDADLAWIDRDTAVARILAQPLLFAPGSDRRHSHSAFVLLAAVVEKISGVSYAEFLRREILTPLGMTRTGFYGETAGLKLGNFATGYGESAVGLPNIPPNWGPTSWLVMGSGGMFSTLPDMLRYYDGLEAGKILTGEWLRRGPTMGIGGSDRGFYFLHVANGQGTRVLLVTNSEGRRPAMRALTRGLEGLVLGNKPPGGASSE